MESRVFEKWFSLVAPGKTLRCPLSQSTEGQKGAFALGRAPFFEQEQHLFCTTENQPLSIITHPTQSQTDRLEKEVNETFISSAWASGFPDNILSITLSEGSWSREPVPLASQLHVPAFSEKALCVIAKHTDTTGPHSLNSNSHR